MTTKKVLTRTDIGSLITEIGQENPFELCRAIEQAVLQSAEIQALREDAERYQWLRDKSLTYSGFQADGVDGWIVMRRDSSLRRVFSYTNTDLDDAVDAAMEKQK